MGNDKNVLMMIARYVEEFGSLPDDSALKDRSVSTIINDIVNNPPFEVSMFENDYKHNVAKELLVLVSNLKDIFKTMRDVDANVYISAASTPVIRVNYERGGKTADDIFLINSGESNKLSIFAIDPYTQDEIDRFSHVVFSILNIAGDIRVITDLALDAYSYGIPLEEINNTFVDVAKEFIRDIKKSIEESSDTSGVVIEDTYIKSHQYAIVLVYRLKNGPERSLTIRMSYTSSLYPILAHDPVVEIVTNSDSNFGARLRTAVDELCESHYNDKLSHSGTGKSDTEHPREMGNVNAE